MRLRNKKTDAIVELIRIEITDDRWIRLDCRQRNGVEYCMFYRSLVELNDEWMDYTPRKPLIKDEKIRKAVRAWAEANTIRAVYYSPEEDGFYVKNFDNEIVASIYFGDKPMEEDGYGEHYTITELCGEEE